jgi:hypothetical protein
MSIIRKLKTNEFALLIALASVLVQSPNSKAVFLSISTYTGTLAELQAWGFALILDIAILYYTVKNRKDVALFFAVIQVCMNLLYYWNGLEFSKPFLTALVISVCLPVSVYFYSEEIKLDPEEVSLPGNSMLPAYTEESNLMEEPNTVKGGLTAEDIPVIRTLLDEGKPYKEIADIYGVHFTTIGKIKNNQIWKDA